MITDSELEDLVDLLLNTIYDDKIPTADRIEAIRRWKDLTMTVTPGPALTLIDGGKKFCCLMCRF